jgi:zinc protease
MIRSISTATLALALSMLVGCGPSKAPEPETTTGEEVAEAPPEAPAKEPPPESAPPRDLKFPETTESEQANGLKLLALPQDALPVLYAQLVIRSGNATAPEARPGLASLVAAMMEQGTKKKSAEKLAEAVEFLGASLSVSADADSLVITVRSLAEHMGEAISLLAEVATQPSFDAKELEKLKKRELDRLKLASRNPEYLARRAFYDALYGDHPYAAIDTTEEAVKGVTRGQLVAWHAAHVVPNNAFLVVAGDFDQGALEASVANSFGAWKPREVKAIDSAPIPEARGRRVILIHRPESVQSAIRIGNLAIPRASVDWIPLEVANEVLGGSASSRLFMDLREKRSFTYGAYSAVAERRDPGAFAAMAQVRNEVTLPAVEAFFEHLERIVREAPDERELADARNSLSNSFPLSIETTGKIVGLVTQRELYGLAPDYWSTYRSQVLEVTPETALAHAKRHIEPQSALVVIVGQTADLVEPLRKLGPVTLMDVDGKVLKTLDAVE